MALSALAQSKGMRLEALGVHKHNYEFDWWAQQEILFDRCRIRGKPTLLLKIAPAEWKYPTARASISSLERAAAPQ